MRHLTVVLLAVVLTGGAVASARAARFDPPYDEDRVVAELAAHEYELSDETDVTVPVVRCTEPATTRDTPGRPGAAAVVLGRHHLGVEGREVMPLSVDPAGELGAQTSGATIHPLVAELEWQRRIASARGRRVFEADLYADETMPFSASQTVLQSTELHNRLVIRDVETSRLRALELLTSPHHSRNRCIRTLNVDEHHVVSDDGVELLSLDGHPDVSALATTIPALGWDVGIRVTGNASVHVVAAILALFDPTCSGGTHNVFLEMHSAEEASNDGYAVRRRCTKAVPVFGALGSPR